LDKKRLLATSSILVEQLRNEANMLRDLSHPNIVQFVDVTEDERSMYIIMECLRGGELFDIIAQTGSISEADAALVISCISAALKYLHKKQIMHRDIKPENLLLKHERDFRQVKLADFGFAYKSKEGTWYVGTGGYLAPELRQRKPYTDKVDIFALGCILYLMLSGQLPFGTSSQPLGFGDSIHQYYKLTFPGDAFAGVSRQAKELAWTMLHTNASQRWSAAQVLKHRWLKDAARYKNNLHTIAYAKRLTTTMVNSVAIVASSDGAVSPSSEGMCSSDDTPLRQKLTHIQRASLRTVSNRVGWASLPTTPDAAAVAATTPAGSRRRPHSARLSRGQKAPGFVSVSDCDRDHDDDDGRVSSPGTTAHAQLISRLEEAAQSKAATRQKGGARN
jgi:serine/threonine protein kinase